MVERETGIQSVLEGIRRRLEGRLAEIPVVDCPASDTENWCDIRELLRHEDSDFVRNVYRTMLRREPDWAGLEYRLLALRAGRITRLQTIRDIAVSPEGKARRVRLIEFDWQSQIDQYSGDNPVDGAGGSLSPTVIHDWRDLERREGRDFIASLFRLVLGLEPDDSMVTQWLEILQSGCLSKREAITAFLHTAEGRRQGVFAKGDPENNRSVDLLIERNGLLESKLKSLEEDLRTAVAAFGELTGQMRERAEQQGLLLHRMQAEQDQIGHLRAGVPAGFRG